MVHQKVVIKTVEDVSSSPLPCGFGSDGIASILNTALFLVDSTDCKSISALMQQALNGFLKTKQKLKSNERNYYNCILWKF